MFFTRKLQNIEKKSEKNIQFSFEKHKKKKKRLIIWILRVLYLYL